MSYQKERESFIARIVNEAAPTSRAWCGFPFPEVPVFSMNLRYHVMSGQKDGRCYVHDATTGEPCSPDYCNLRRDDADSIALALNRENGCYVQHDEHTYRLRIDRPAVIRIESASSLVCSLPVVLPSGEPGRIVVPVADGVHVARFVGMGIEVYDPSGGSAARSCVLVLPPVK